MNDMFPQIDFRGGEFYPIRSCFDWKKSVASQLDILREDMFHVKYLNGHSMDVGWYPSFDETGCFKLFVILNDNWEQPLETIHTQSYDEVVGHLRRMVDCYSGVK